MIVRINGKRGKFTVIEHLSRIFPHVSPFNSYSNLIMDYCSYYANFVFIALQHDGIIIFYISLRGFWRHVPAR